MDGGASRDRFLMQFQADISACPIHRPVIRETTAQLIVGIRNTLNLYDVDHAGGTISGVVLTGTGARLIGLPPVLASSINKVVRIGDPFIRFRLSKEVERQNIMAHAIDLGAVLGLVIGKKPR